MKKTIAALFAVGVLATGCNLAVSADEAADGGAAPGEGTAMCAPGVTDCVDAVVEDGAGDAAGSTRPSDDTLREVAQSLLGTAEEDLGDLARVGRRGEEHMMLTEDYVIGRFTVELDDDGSGTFRVTAVTVEMEEGPETFEG